MRVAGKQTMKQVRFESMASVLKLLVLRESIQKGVSMGKSLIDFRHGEKVYKYISLMFSLTYKST